MNQIFMFEYPNLGICGTDTNFMYYESGVFDNVDCCHDQNHAVLIVGYDHDDELNVDYWIMQNSWGKSWGEAGFIRILKTSNSQPGICGFNLFSSVPYGGYLVNDNFANVYNSYNSTNLKNISSPQHFNSSNSHDSSGLFNSFRDLMHIINRYFADFMIWAKSNWRVSGRSVYSDINLFYCSSLFTLFRFYLHFWLHSF